MTQEKVLIVGAGKMALEYAKVLAKLNIDTIVFGRGAASAETYFTATGVRPSTGSLEQQLDSLTENLPKVAIVTVNAMYLAEVTTFLAQKGVERILVEKPIALDLAEMNRLLVALSSTNAKVFVAYNRRFMASVLRANEIIREDAGVLSVKFDFSEPAQRIATLSKPQRELDTWFYGNSSHVLDLAFSFFGPVKQLNAQVSGQNLVDWHPSASIFTGSAISTRGTLMSWHANWAAPGRWGIEVMTPKRRLIFQPLEQLRIQTHDSFTEISESLDESHENGTKPGLLGQVRAFLYGKESQRLPSLEEQAHNMKIYDLIRTGGNL